MVKGDALQRTLAQIWHVHTVKARDTSQGRLGTIRKAESLEKTEVASQ